MPSDPPMDDEKRRTMAKRIMTAADYDTHALYAVVDKDDFRRLLAIAFAVEALEATRRGRERRGASAAAYARVDALARASFDGDAAALDRALKGEG